MLIRIHNPASVSHLFGQQCRRAGIGQVLSQFWRALLVQPWVLGDERKGIYLSVRMMQSHAHGIPRFSKIMTHSRAARRRDHRSGPPTHRARSRMRSTGIRDKLDMWSSVYRTTSHLPSEGLTGIKGVPATTGSSGAFLKDGNLLSNTAIS